MTLSIEEIAEIRKELLLPESARKAYVRSIGELCHTLKLKVSWLNPKFGKAVEMVKRPIGWRREILQRQRKSVIKNLVQANIYDPNPYRHLGRLIGLFENSIENIANDHFYPQEEEYWEEVFAPFLDVDEETRTKIEQYFEKMQMECERLDAFVLALPQPQQKEFSLGRAEYLDAIFGENSTFTYANTTTPIYNFLLMTGDVVGKLGSVEDIYDFSRHWLKGDFPHDLESFRKICNRVGLRGVNCLSAERRARSMDRAKRRVQ